jgi:hypothetical protein
LTKKGYILPKYNTTIITLNYLTRVTNKLEFCLKKKSENENENEIEIEIENEVKVCINPPKRLILLEMILEELQKKGIKKTITYDEKHLPDVDWCLFTIFQLNP